MEKEISNQPVNEVDERELIWKCQRGDKAAFDKIVLKYYKWIFNMAYRLLGDYHEADDLCQETFIRAYRKIGFFRGESSFYTWLYRIGANLSLNRLKKYKKEVKTVSLNEINPVLKKELIETIPDSGNNPNSILEKKEFQEHIQNALSSLPYEYRMVVILGDLQGFSYDEIATTLKCSMGTVKSRLNRGRSILRERFKDII